MAERRKIGEERFGVPRTGVDLNEWTGKGSDCRCIEEEEEEDEEVVEEQEEEEQDAKLASHPSIIDQ